MRCFVALDLPESTRVGLRPLLHERLHGAKWVPEAQTHLTLRFLGELNEEAYAALREALGRIRAAPFSLSPHGLGVFPDLRRPRVLWVGLAAPPTLFSLQAAVEAAAAECGLPPETKPFAPHLTLARFRSLPDRHLADFLARHRDFALPSFPIAEFHLYSSRLSPKGAEHRREAGFPLR